jgi:beta-glucosidase
LLGGFDVVGKRWSLKAGDYQVAVGASSATWR